MTDDLITFLNARLDEDEATAKAATPGEWLALDGGVQSADDESQWPVADTQSARNRADRIHIALNAPASVLADIAADRALLAAYRRAAAVARFPDHEGGYADGLEDAIRIRAARFAGHPDYRAEEWKP